MAGGKSAFPMYKGRPLVRCGDLLYYGDMREKYVVRMQVRSKKTYKPTGTLDEGKHSMKELGDLEVADKIFIQLMNTDMSVSPQKAIVKSGEQSGLFAALDYGYVWLEQALNN